MSHLGNLARGLAVALALVSTAQAQGLRKVEVIVFPAGFNWPLWTAQETGLFARNGLEPHVTETPNSIFQLTGLIDGRFDIAMTAVDNPIAYMEGQGEAPTQEKPDIFSFMGGSNGFLSLLAVPEVKSFEDLRGKVLSVDAMTTGYAFVLQKMLETKGLKTGDYTLVKVGGMVQRYEALMRKDQAATLLVPPFDSLPKEKGFSDLGTAAGVLGHYQGSVGTTRRVWAESHRQDVVAYIRAYAGAIDWLRDPANREAALAIFMKRQPGADRAAAEKAAAVMLDPVTGFQPSGKLDIEGVRTVMALRSQYGEPRKTLTDPYKYFDLSYYDEAMKH